MSRVGGAVPFDPSDHRPGSRGAAGLCSHCHRPAVATVTQARTRALCVVHLGAHTRQLLPFEVFDDRPVDSHETKALVVTCTGAYEHPGDLFWDADHDLRFGRCEACGQRVLLGDDGLTLPHAA